jgi:hypothetical protein
MQGEIGPPRAYRSQLRRGACRIRAGGGLLHQDGELQLTQGLSVAKCKDTHHGRTDRGAAQLEHQRRRFRVVRHRKASFAPSLDLESRTRLDHNVDRRSDLEGKGQGLEFRRGYSREPDEQ